METTITIRLDQALKQRFQKALRMGRPATTTDVVEHLLVAYAECAEAAGEQPEFPLEVRAKRRRRPKG